MSCLNLKKKEKSLKEKAVSEAVDGLMKGLLNGELSKFCTDGALIAPPGTPQMDVKFMYEMCKPLKIAFPKWICEVRKVKQIGQNQWTVETRQSLGAMQTDLPAVGPFPAVNLKDVPDWIKTKDGLQFPFEIGTYTFTEDMKIIQGTYEGKINEKNTKKVSKEILTTWNKKGDLSDTGFGAMYQAMGVVIEKPAFFLVDHEFVEGKAGAFWEMVGSMVEKDWIGMGEKNNQHGFHNHSFLPASTNGPVFCLWESEKDITVEEFQKFIDGPDGPGGEGTFINKVHKINDAGKLPISHFQSGRPNENFTVPKPGTGSTFFIDHAFNDGQAQVFWDLIKSWSPEDWVNMAKKHEELGFYNTSFLPGREKGPYCVWETKKEMSIEEFQAFIDGENGPDPSGKIFTNTVYKVIPGAKTLPPFFKVNSSTLNKAKKTAFSEIDGNQVDVRVE